MTQNADASYVLQALFLKHQLSSLICSPPSHSVIIKEIQMTKPIKSNSGWEKKNTDTHLTFISSGSVARHPEQWLTMTELLRWGLPLQVVLAPADEAAGTTPVCRGPRVSFFILPQRSTQYFCFVYECGGKQEDC